MWLIKKKKNFNCLITDFGLITNFLLKNWEINDFLYSLAANYNNFKTIAILK